VGIVIVHPLKNDNAEAAAAIVSLSASEVGIATVTEKASVAVEVAEAVMVEGETIESVHTMAMDTMIRGANEGIDRTRHHGFGFVYDFLPDFSGFSRVPVPASFPW